jgi:hypothetical protein
MGEKIEQTERTKLKRIPKRGHFDRETVYKILDEATSDLRLKGKLS